MRAYYTENTIQEEKSQFGFYLFLLILSDVLSLVGILLFFLFMNRHTRILFLIFIILLGLWFVFASLYFPFRRLFPLRKRMSFEKRILNSSKEKITGVVKDISPSISSPYEIRVKPITILLDGESKVFYLDEEIPLSFAKDEEVTLWIANRLIVGDMKKEDSPLPYGHEGEAFNQHVKKFWPAYLFSSLLVIVLSAWGSGLGTAIKPEEKISFFSISYPIQEDKLKQDLMNFDSSFLEVDCLNYTPDTPYQNTLITAGLVDSDILLLPKGTLSDADALRATALIPEETLKTLFPPSIPYKIEEKTYGILFHQKGEEKHLRIDSYLDYGKGDKEESYLLYFNLESCNLGSLKKDSKTDRALKVAQYLLGEMP